MVLQKPEIEENVEHPPFAQTKNEATIALHGNLYHYLDLLDNFTFYHSITQLIHVRDFGICFPLPLFHFPLVF